MFAPHPLLQVSATISDLVSIQVLCDAVLVLLIRAKILWFGFFVKM